MLKSLFSYVYGMYLMSEKKYSNPDYYGSE